MNQRLAPLLIGGKERRPDIIIAHMAVSGPVQAVGSIGVAPGVAPPLSLLRPVCCHRKLPGRCFHVIKYRHAHSDTRKLTNGSFTDGCRRKSRRIAAPVGLATSAITGGRVPKGYLQLSLLSFCDLPCHAASLNSRSHCRGSTLLLGPEPPEYYEGFAVLRASPHLRSTARSVGPTSLCLIWTCLGRSRPSGATG